MSLTISREAFVIRKHFDDVPAQYQTYQLARIYIGTGKCSLKGIPERFIDDDLRLLAVEMAQSAAYAGLAKESLMAIKPSDTERYEELALASIRYDDSNVRYVDSTVMGNEFMKKALAVNGDALLAFLRDAAHMGRIDLTQELIDLAISNSATYFKFDAFPLDQYRVEAVSQCIKSQKFNLRDLLKVGHFQTLVEVIKEGCWPDHFPEKPSGLKSGIDTMMHQPEHSILVYRAYVMSHPISEVVAHMTNTQYSAELLNMYSKEELAPFLKNGPLAKDREFKGRLLENELGL
jgi:hypothetical protein